MTYQILHPLNMPPHQNLKQFPIHSCIAKMQWRKSLMS